MRYLGYAMLATPFVALAIIGLFTIGWWKTALCLAAPVVLGWWLATGVRLSAGKQP